jgi:TolB-like protein
MTQEKTCSVLWILISFLLAASGRAEDQKSPGLVRLITPSKTVIVGEVGRRNDTHIEVFDLKTGQPSTFKIEDLLSFKEPVADSSAIATVGLPNFLAWKIKQNLPHGSGIGKIARIDGATIYVTLGSDHRIEAARGLRVFRGEEPIKDPASGKVLGKQHRQIAQLEIVEVTGAKLSTAKVVGKPEVAVEVGDVVETVAAKDAVAILPLVDVEGNESAEGKNLVEEWTTTLVSRGVPVVERKRLDDVLKELNLQQTKEFDPEKAKKVGKQIGAATVLTGTVVVSKSGYGSVQLRLMRVDTGEIALALAHSMGRVAGQSTPAGASRGKLPGKGTKYSFASEKEITENWEIHGDWRIENGGLKLSAGSVISSKRFFKGDFAMETICASGERSNGSVTIEMWGDKYSALARGTGIVKFARKGDQVAIIGFDNKMPTAPTVVTLKDAQVKKESPIKIIYSDSYASGAPGEPLYLMRLGASGTEVEPAAEKAPGK